MSVCQAIRKGQVRGAGMPESPAASTGAGRGALPVQLRAAAACHGLCQLLCCQCRVNGPVVTIVTIDALQR